MSDVIDFEKCKVADLKRMLKERGLSNAGIKSDLVTRLQAYEGASSENGAEDVVADEDELLQDGEDEEAEDDDEEDEDEGAGEKAEEEAEVEAEEEAELECNVIDAEADEAEEATAAKDEEAAAPKTIKLNKPVLITSTTVSKPAATEEPEEATGEAEDTAGTPEETPGMLAKRAERFGIQSADAKKLARAQRFGIPITAPTASANGKSSIKVGASAAPTAEELEKLKKRAERFGTVVSEPLVKVAEKEKILKRKERFGALTTTSSSSSSTPASNQEMDEKKRRRLERFGNAAK